MVEDYGIKVIGSEEKEKFSREKLQAAAHRNENDSLLPQESICEGED